MQLNHQGRAQQAQKHKRIALALAQASVLLLGGNHAQAATPDNAATNPQPESGFNWSQITERGWLVDSAVLLYQEADNRVQATEPSVRVQKDFGDQRIFTGKLTVDSLTGASPNGATSASVPQTFTSASGNNTYTTPAGELPLDTEFKDTRVALSANWQQPVAQNLTLNVGGNLSKEYDYMSAGASASLAKDFNQKNTTLSAGLSFEFDQIDPVGGAPKPLTSMFSQQKDGGDNKTVTDVLLGLTQVLNRHAVLQLNYSASLMSGYQSDPYKVLSAVDASGNLLTEPTVPNRGVYLFESRPDSRTRHSIYSGLKYGFDRGDVLETSYRFTSDDWGIQSHTLDAKYRYHFADQRYYVEPHLRYYSQNAADFYHSYLQQGREVNVSASGVQALVEHASADSRLGAFDAVTYGIKFGMQLPKDRELTLRIEQYEQQAQDLKPIGGQLANQILQPDLSATWAQLGYQFKW